ncbi:MAG: hypothetical protein ACYS1A_20485, partial [Planctomycetota bacterium]
MAIANVGTRGEVGFPAQSGTLGVTINAATNLAVVTVGWWDGTPITPGPFSIDGTGFTEVISKFDDTNYMYTSIWQLVNPSTGSQTLSYNMAENPSDPSQIIIEFFSGVDTASPIRGSGAADQGDGSPCTTPAITSAVGDLGLCVVCSYNADAVADGGSQTEYDNQSQSTTFLATGWLAGASPSITMQGNGANDSICACSIQASATTEALAGTIAASSTVSGLLPVTRSVIGSIAASSTVTGILPITRSL